MRLTFKYRLFPTPAQRAALNRARAICTRVYNETLHIRRQAWEARQESLSLYDTIKLLPGWKAEHPFLKEVYSQTLQDVCVRVDLAFQAFFRRVKAGEKPGYPRYTSQDCSGCGERVKKGLSVRIHACPRCALEIDRDLNAALNVLARGLSGIGSNP